MYIYTDDFIPIKIECVLKANNGNQSLINKTNGKINKYFSDVHIILSIPCVY